MNNKPHTKEPLVVVVGGQENKMMTIVRISQILRIIPLLITIFSLNFPVYAKYSGGTGEPDDPYQIARAEDLMLLGESPNDYDKHFILTADIDLDPNLPGRKVFERAVIAPVNDSEDFFQGTRFTGVFDGNDLTISNMIIESGEYLGLFGVLENGAEVKNLGVVDVSITGSGGPVGGLAGLNYGSITMSYSMGSITAEGGSVGGLVGSNIGIVTSSYSTGSVSGDGSRFGIGGLVGWNDDSSIISSYSTCLVSGYRNVGGLVGANSDSTITMSYSTGSVSGDRNVGGLVGSSYGHITMSYSTGMVIGYDYVGGLVGHNDGSITTSCSTGAVAGNRSVGGLVGDNYDSITNCYSTGMVKGNENVGGLVGVNRDGSISVSYSTSTVSGEEGVGGLAGYNSEHGNISTSLWDIETSGLLSMCGIQGVDASGCDDSYGKTTAEMHTADTFLEAGWDFTEETENGPNDVWKIVEGQTYPLLFWQKYGGGTGEPNDPYLIYTAEHLDALGAEPNDYDKHFKLMADVDLSEYVYDRAVIAPDVNDDEYWFQGTAFTGVFDGNGHTISHLTITGVLDWYYCVGLFGHVASDAELKNLGVVDVNIVIGGRCIGGLVGYNSGALVHCNSTGAVSGRTHVGGLAGVNSGTITTSYSTTTVSAGFILGALVGVNNGSISNCYSTGDVSGDEFVGGLVCGNLGSITNCYSTGMIVVYDAYSGGLVVGNSGSIISSFWDIETSGQTTSDGGTGLTRADMQTASTFLEAGWDFVEETENGTEDIWWMPESDYPRLCCELIPEN